MMKRKRPSDEDLLRSSKKARRSTNYRLELDRLSDELVLKILAHAPISGLAVAQRVCRRLQRLAGDSELWKQNYFLHFVRPRALRIPGLKETEAEASSGALLYSSKLAKWLDHGHLLGRETDWKRQYKLMHNWGKGRCRLKELEVAQPPVPAVLVKLHHGIIYTVDTEHGLRAWTAKSESHLIASRSLVTSESSDSIPTSLGLDISSTASDRSSISVGMEDGSFQLYTFHLASQMFDFNYAHPASSNGAISAIAAAGPYILTMSHNKILSLYQFSSYESMTNGGTLDHPELLASLKSDMVYAPISLSIRTSASNIVACVAYAFSRLGRGWAVGIQELRLTTAGITIGSRLTSTADLGSSSFQSIKDHHLSISARSTSSKPFALHPHSMARPGSLSYSHPYLLASLPDNTLMIYLVMSDADNLTITAGRRLWGHTSSVSGAEVSGRGKAVSVSTKGNEIRVWELEDVITSTSNRRSSIRITPEKADLTAVGKAIARRGDGLGLALHEMQRELALTRSWVGFDDEQVVVLGERSKSQIISCYDFT